MSFIQLLRILWARRRLVIVTTVSTVVLAIVVWLVMPKNYVGTTSLVIDTRAADPVTGASPNIPSVASIIGTQIDVITSRAVALKVVDALKLPTDEASAAKSDLPQHSRSSWANALLNDLEVKPVADGNVVRIKYEDGDPAFAASVANAFAEAYMQTSLELRLDPARRQSVWFDEQLRRLRSIVEDRRQKLSDYQRSHGIVATSDRLDVENARLDEISRQLLDAQRNAQTAGARLHQAQQAGNGDRLNEVPEIMSNSLVQSLKSDLVRAESRLAELGQRYDRNHPQYMSAQAQVQELRQKIAAEVGRAKGSIEQSAQIAQRQATDLQRAFDEQKQHILELSRQRDELSVQDREVQNAQAAYDAALQRSSQLRLESQLNQTSVAVLDTAIEPGGPAGLGLVLTSILSLVFGGMLGAALALLLEMFDRRVRDGDELVSVAGLEVLGEIPRLRANFKSPKPALPRGNRTLLEGGHA
jgi:succinoglycan biosynthesis transport protein ExoP